MLQQLVGDDLLPRWALRVGLACAGLLACAVAIGCGPVEPEPLDNGPPFIGEVSPKQSVLFPRGNDTGENLRAIKLYDPNREEGGLSIAWIGSRQGVIGTTTTDHLEETTLQRRTFHLYEEVEQNVDPCNSSSVDETAGQETIWLYVSDRPMEIDFANREVETTRDGYLVSHSWVLDFVCQ